EAVGVGGGGWGGGETVGGSGEKGGGPAAQAEAAAPGRPGEPHHPRGEHDGADPPRRPVVSRPPAGTSAGADDPRAAAGRAGGEAVRPATATEGLPYAAHGRAVAPAPNGRPRLGGAGAGESAVARPPTRGPRTTATP